MAESSVEDLKLSRLELIHLNEMPDGNWRFVVEAQFLKEVGENSIPYRQNIIAGTMDATGKLISSALLTKTQRDGGGGSALCFDKKNATYMMYTDNPKNMQLPSNSTEIKEIYNVLKGHTLVAAYEDNKITKLPEVFQFEDIAFAPEYSKKVGRNKYLIISTASVNFYKFKIGLLTVKE